MDVVQTKRNEAVRMETLAKLPVFWDLTGKAVVLCGGSDAAAWKAELLLACGAQLHIYCPQRSLGETMCSLTVRDLPNPAAAILHHDTEWSAECFLGAVLAIADCDDEQDAEVFFEAAKRAGVPANVIDKPQFCQFQFGSIVNRSPVVVSISTDGAAPILAQAIRRRIETLLPHSLQGWADMAQSLRERVNGKLAPGNARRNFWERFVDRAFTEKADELMQDKLISDIHHAFGGGEGTYGKVTLVGAGPGDAELLTLKAVRALQAADIILFDDLVSDEVLELARREAKRMLVGKRGGRTSCKQEDINTMMINFAKAGKRVVRLKSGDPMIFGRAGEEIAALEAQDIPVEVVPGVTAASAMASRLGVSLTHRDHAQSVRFVTGHSRLGHLPENLDWNALASPTVTTVFYMGGRTATEIKSRLIEHGMSDCTPLVIMSAITRAGERRWCGRLSDLDAGIIEIGVDEPVLIGIGNAFAPALERREQPIEHFVQMAV
ncbi:uroporphyrin-III C-methyltransferase/precorrin-2 dehydrogenase/sirohydrochlorin ferrochelatase [Rhizobium sp. BIGb0125]|uniref:siroheme synthase CysG n=1 Tax=Rhizobium sp. BIGb0125 TaxID=2940618 RepID=UPI0021683AF2|nr:siroheme synthase CysG [Rhizobium sp. BIGb0125]MCS4242913.1 uroporphyrin-III C-methyltransferase/precorrin-2 dehydrogenase/sirohydrochlorin ferrochelatase [Rhizobium sp. BIGb0125]